MKDPPVTDARMAAAHGDAVARFWLGLCYASGSGVRAGRRAGRQKRHERVPHGRRTGPCGGGRTAQGA